MPGRDSRGRKRQSPKIPVIRPGGKFRFDVRAIGERSDYGARALLQDATEMTPNYRQTSGFDREIRDPKITRRYHCADGSDAANPRPGASPNPIRRDTRDRPTAQRGSEGTPWENPAAPTALVSGQRHCPSPVRRSL